MPNSQATDARSPKSPGPLAGGHPELHSSRGAGEEWVHAAVRLLERGRHPLRDAGGSAALSGQQSAGNATKGSLFEFLLEPSALQQ